MDTLAGSKFQVTFENPDDIGHRKHIWSAACRTTGLPACLSVSMSVSMSVSISLCVLVCIPLFHIPFALSPTHLRPWPPLGCTYYCIIKEKTQKFEAVRTREWDRERQIVNWRSKAILMGDWVGNKKRETTKKHSKKKKEELCFIVLKDKSDCWELRRINLEVL